jgi:hypothetical protein
MRGRCSGQENRWTPVRGADGVVESFELDGGGLGALEMQMM